MDTPLGPKRKTKLDHVLVVDDEPLIVSSVRDLLRLEGYVTSGAYSGQEAMHQLEISFEEDNLPIDLVVLDISLPKPDGLEVCRWLKAHPKLGRIPVLMLTAAASSRDMVIGLDTGAEDYVTKPYSTSELLARIRALLRSYRIDQHLVHRNQQLADLNRIVATISSTIRTERVLNEALNGVLQVFDVEASALWLLDRSGQILLCHRAVGRDETWNPGGKLTLGEGIAGAAARHRRLELVNDVRADPRFRPILDQATGLETRSVLAVPVTAKDRLIGVIQAINKVAGTFDAEDSDLLVSLAASVAFALENARLFADTRSAYVRMEASQLRLMETANTLRALFDGITDGLYIVDREWRLVALNKSRSQQTSLPTDDAIGRECYRSLYGRSQFCQDCQVPETLKDGQGRKWVEHTKTAIGLFDEWELSTYPIFDANGDVVQTIVWRREVTEQRRLEASLAQAEKLAAIGQLAAGVAHEINNPLTAIIANAQLLQEDLPPGDDTFHSAELIAGAGERAARVVRRLLDFARQEPGDRQAVDINQSLREALTLLELQFRSARIEVATHLEPGLPSVSGSGDRLQTVWVNLLLNARDALRETVPVITGRRLELRTGRQGEMLEVAIGDNGPGIPKHRIPLLFNPFFTTKSPGEGTGLGLSTSFRIVEQHGGMIDVVSEPGQGTTFLIRLPIGE